MTEPNISLQNRSVTEQKILQAVANIIAEQGFEKVGINQLAQRANVSKVLIYRYFGNLDNLMAHYVLQQDYWASINIKPSDIKNINQFLKELFHKQIKQLQDDIILKRLSRWELFINNSTIEQIRKRREKNGCELIDLVSQLTHSSSKEVAALASILSASISYLAMISEANPIYNGINLQTEQGWQQITQTIDLIIDLWLKQSMT